MGPAPTQANDDVEARAAVTMVVFIAVAAMLWVVASALAAALPSDRGFVSDELARLFVGPAVFLHPEPTERRIFVVGLLLLPGFALGGAWLAVRYTRWRPWLAGLAVPLAAYALLVLAVYPNALEFLRLTDSLVWMMLALGIAVACLDGSTRGPWMNIRRNRASAVVALLVASLAVYFAFIWRTFDIRALQTTWRHEQHLDAVLYTVSQAAKGRVAIADYPSQYGFFGSLLAPWFRLVGLSVLSLTVTLNALQGVALTALAAFAFREFKHLPLAIGVSMAVLYFVNSWSALTGDPDPYFQYAPVRFFFPAVSVLLVSEWLRAPTPRRAALISLVAGVAVVWNLDSGVAVAGGWLLLLSYQLTSVALAREDWRPRAKTLGMALGLIALPALAFFAWILWRAQGHVDFGLAIQSQRLFYGTGFFMLPMPTRLHPWHVVAAILVFGVVLGSMRVIGKTTDRRAWVILYVALLGLGLFTYYQGRSHDRVLIYVAWPAIVIAFLAADWAWDLAQGKRLRRSIAAAIAAPILTFGILCGLHLVHDIPGTARMAQRRLHGAVATPWILENLRMVRDATRGRTDAVILARFQGVYFAEAGLASSLRGPGNVEVILRAQGADIVRQIEQMLPPVVFLGKPFLVDKKRNPYATLLPILSQRYRITATSADDQFRLYTLRETTPR